MCCTGNLQPSVQSTVLHHLVMLPLPVQGLQLVCDTSDSVSVDVLIGADYYWSFFTGNIMKGDPYGPVALETNLGWVLSGPTMCSTLTRSCTVNLSSTHVLKIGSTEISDMKGDLQKF